MPHSPVREDAMSDREAILKGRVEPKVDPVEQAAQKAQATVEEAKASNTNTQKPDMREFRFHPWLNIWFYGTELQHAQARLTSVLTVVGAIALAAGTTVFITDRVHVVAGWAASLALIIAFLSLLAVRLLMKV